MHIYQDRLFAKKQYDQELVGETVNVAVLPTELWRIIIRMAAHFPVDFDFVTDDPWEMTTVANHLEAMPTKLALMRVSRQFNWIVREFFFDLVYIPTEDSAVRFGMFIAPQDESGDERRWVHRGWRMVLKIFGPGRSLRPTNVVARNPDINIRYLYLEELDEYYVKVYASTVADILKSKCCSNLVSLIIGSGVSNVLYNAFAQSVIAAIPPGLKLLSWNAHANERSFFPLLERVCGSLERLRVCPARISPQWPRRTTGITFPKLTHFVLLGEWNGCYLHMLSEWQMPSLTHLTIGKSVTPNALHFRPFFRSIQNLEYLQIHLQSPSSRQFSIEPTLIDEPHPDVHPLIITCHDWSYNFPTTPIVLRDILHIFDRKSFPKMKAVDVFGLRSCKAFPWWIKTEKEVEATLREVSHDLALPGVEIRVLS